MTPSSSHHYLDSKTEVANGFVNEVTTCNNKIFAEVISNLASRGQSWSNNIESSNNIIMSLLSQCHKNKSINLTLRVQWLRFLIASTQSKNYKH